MNESARRKPTAKFFPPPTLPTVLIDYFSTSNHSYKTQEISSLIRLYDGIDHPLSLKIQNLLSATVLFRSRTKREYREARQSKNEQEQLETLNDMGVALTNAQNEHATENTTDGSKAIFATALDYCITSINQRLTDLKSTQDEIYMLYLTQDNQLRPLLIPKQNGPTL